MGRQNKIFGLTLEGRLVSAVFFPAVLFHLSLFAMLSHLQRRAAILLMSSASPQVLADLLDRWVVFLAGASFLFLVILVVILMWLARWVNGKISS